MSFEDGLAAEVPDVEGLLDLEAEGLDVEPETDFASGEAPASFGGLNFNPSIQPKSLLANFVDLGGSSSSISNDSTRSGCAAFVGATVGGFAGTAIGGLAGVGVGAFVGAVDLDGVARESLLVSCFFLPKENQLFLADFSSVGSSAGS